MSINDIVLGIHRTNMLPNCGCTSDTMSISLTSEYSSYAIGNFPILITYKTYHVTYLKSQFVIIMCDYEVVLAQMFFIYNL